MDLLSQPMGMPRTFGENLKRLREKKGVTQEKLAAAIGYKRSANISLLETRRALPRPETIVKVARALGIPTSAFLEDVDVPYDALRADRPVAHRPTGGAGAARARRQAG